MCIMVSLKNLIDNGDTLECDYFPENDMNNKCHLVIDKKTEEIISVSGGETKPSMYAGGARSKLAKYIGREDEFPEIEFCIWG